MGTTVSMMKSKDFQSLLQRYFMERLINQQRVSPCTIESYRDTFRIFLKYMNDMQHIKSEKYKWKISMRIQLLNS